MLAAILTCVAGLGGCSPAPNRTTAAPKTHVNENTVVVSAVTMARRLSAYAQVRPIVPVRVRAAQAGTVIATRVLPGSSVRAGEILARLGGTQIAALMARQAGAVSRARARYATDRQLLAIARQRLALDLDTRQTVLVAQSADAAARADLGTATADLRAVRSLSELRAPANGRVLAVDAADGERVTSGQTVLVLQADGRLWLRALYYGADADALRVGMTGTFQPSGPAPAVRVRVATVAASLGADGGAVVGLVEVRPSDTAGRPSSTPLERWRDGEWGTVTIDAGRRSMVAVPTDALVLDRTHWFVLVETPRGIVRREVVPGPVRGWRTFVEQGLKPGERVVAQNASLEFHHGIAARYTPPD